MRFRVHHLLLLTACVAIYFGILALTTAQLCRTKPTSKHGNRIYVHFHLDGLLRLGMAAGKWADKYTARFACQRQHTNRRCRTNAFALRLTGQ